MGHQRRYPTYIKLLLGCLLALASALGTPGHHAGHAGAPIAASHH